MWSRCRVAQGHTWNGGYENFKAFPCYLSSLCSWGRPPCRIASGFLLSLLLLFAWNTASGASSLLFQSLRAHDYRSIACKTKAGVRPQQEEPGLKAPWFWKPTELVAPIFLLLDETQPGCEHYNVLVQPPLPPIRDPWLGERGEQPPPPEYLAVPDQPQTEAPGDEGNPIFALEVTSGHVSLAHARWARPATESEVDKGAFSARTTCSRLRLILPVGERMFPVAWKPLLRLVIAPFLKQLSRGLACRFQTGCRPWQPRPRKRNVTRDRLGQPPRQ